MADSEVFVEETHEIVEVKKKGRKGRRNRLKAYAGQGTLEKEKPPIFGMIQLLE